MNYKRAIGLSIVFYFVSIILFIPVAFFFPDRISPGISGQLGISLVYWALLIPLTLLWAKWFFKKQAPSTRRGFFLGLMVIGVSVVIEGSVALWMYFTGQDIGRDIFQGYISWKVYVEGIEIIALTTFAGWEFDRTYTSKM